MVFELARIFPSDPFGDTNPEIVRLLPFDDCVVRSCILLNLKSKYGTNVLFGYASENIGEKYLEDWFGVPANRSTVLKIARRGLDEQIRLSVKYRSSGEIRNALERFHRVETIQRLVQPHIVQALSQEECERHGVLIAYRRDTFFYCWYADEPGKIHLQGLQRNRKFRAQLALVAGMDPNSADQIKLEPFRVDKDDIQREIQKIFAQAQGYGITGKKAQEHIRAINAISDPGETQTAITEVSEGAFQKVLNDIVLAGFDSGSSDVHVWTDQGLKNIHYAIMKEGRSVELNPFPLTYPGQWEAFVRTIFNHGLIPWAMKDKPLNGRLDFDLKGKIFTARLGALDTEKVRFRKHYTPLICFRILREGEKCRTIREVGLRPYDWAMLKQFIALRTGLIALTGPVASGKSEFLGACCIYAKEIYPHRVVATIENPVEKPLGDGIHQIPVPVTTDDVPPAELLNTALRLRLDMIAVGEVNSHEMAELAVKGGTSSQMILTTLHCDDVFDAFIRLKNLGVRPSAYGSALKMLASMRLVRKNCPTCSVRERFMDSFESDKDFHEKWEFLPDALRHWGVDPENFHHSYGTGMKNGQPCPDCFFQGVSHGTVGERAIYEFLPTYWTPIKRMMFADPPESEAREFVYGLYPHQSLYRAGMDLVNQQELSLDCLYDRLGLFRPDYEMIPGYSTEKFAFDMGHRNGTFDADFAKRQADFAERLARLERIESDRRKNSNPEIRPAEVDAIDAVIDEVEKPGDSQQNERNQ